MYMRFGLIPENFRSINFLAWNECDHEECDRLMDAGMTLRQAVASMDPAEEWAYEAGVSVFDPHEMTADTRISVRRRLKYYEPCFEITGEVCGTGADGEPLLKNVTVLREVSHSEVEAMVLENEG